MNINRVILGGNIVRDPELRYATNGTAIVEFTIANNRKWKDKDGEMKESVSFIRCKAFGRTAETIAEHFKKGRPIMVEGRIEQETWEDKQTQQKKEKTGVTVDAFHFCGGEREGAGGGGESRTPRAAAPASRPAPAKAKPADDGEDDDVPF